MWKFESGLHKTYSCPICKDECNAAYSQKRPPINSWASSIAWAGVPENYDEFKCPNSEELWHKQVSRLMQERIETSSPSLRKLISEDIEEILLLRKNTVDKNWKW
jgi:hypothetical protein